jgi:hypothetical protein
MRKRIRILFLVEVCESSATGLTKKERNVYACSADSFFQSRRNDRKRVGWCSSVRGAAATIQTLVRSVEYFSHSLNMESDPQSLFGLLCTHCTAVLIGWDPATPPLPRIWAHIRGRYWSAMCLNLWTQFSRKQAQYARFQSYKTSVFCLFSRKLGL